MVVRHVALWPLPAGSRAFVFDSAAELDEHLAALMLESVLATPSARVALASGATFAGLFADLRRRVDARRLDFSGVRFTHLDEFQGVAPFAPGSLSGEIRDALFPDASPARGSFAPIDARAADATAALETAVARADLVLLGIGRNGHVAFNEPGSTPSSRSRVVDLDPETRAAHAPRFSGGVPPARALTAGVATLLSARRVLLVAKGAAKADVVARALRGPIDPSCPAAAVRLHDRATVLLDSAAAAKLLESPAPAATAPGTEILDRTSLRPSGPVLVVAPHPDDAGISCGALLASCPAGCDRTILTWSSGSRAADASVREREAEEEARDLGANVEFLRAKSYETGAFEPADVDALIAVLAARRPAWVFAPPRDDPHPTHRLCRLSVEEAVRRHVLAGRRAVELWTYEGPWRQIERDAVNVLFRVDAAARSKKLAAVGRHRTQVARVPFDDGAAALMRLRAITFSESDLGGTAAGGFDPKTEIEAFRRESISV